MVKYEIDVQFPDVKRQNIGQWNTDNISLATTVDKLIVESSIEMTQNDLDALALKIQTEEVKTKFNLDALDAWLISEPSIKPYASFFPIISRASEKNTSPGYQLMVVVAQSQDYNIPQNIIDLVTTKLLELGANIGG